MIRKFIVGVLELVVLVMAAYTFFFVNIGRRTPYGHMVAIFSTEPAKEAVEDFEQAGKKLGDKVAGEVRSRALPSASGQVRQDDRVK